jgi:hypothetical protein
MKLILGPVTCQGCRQPVRYVEPDEGLPGWFMFQLNLMGGPVPVFLQRHICWGERRGIPAQILRPWSSDGEPIILEERLTLGAGAPLSLAAPAPGKPSGADRVEAIA